MNRLHKRNWRPTQEAAGDGVDSTIGSHDEKVTTTAMARFALLGIEVHAAGDRAWELRHARGTSIGVVQGIGALHAAAQGFEAARDDVLALVQRLGRAGR